jgi:hypothetical protein
VRLRALRDAEPELGGEHDLVAPAADGAPDEPLVVAVGAVAVAGVDERRAGVERADRARCAPSSSTAPYMPGLSTIAPKPRAGTVSSPSERVGRAGRCGGVGWRCVISDLLRRVRCVHGGAAAPLTKTC